MNNNSGLLLLIAAGILLPFSAALSQNVKPALMQMHHETMQDKYLPNEFGNKRTSPAYKYDNTQHSKTKNTNSVVQSVTNITTVQVNVDSSGLNIIGDAANEPNIAI